MKRVKVQTKAALDVQNVGISGMKGIPSGA